MKVQVTVTSEIGEELACNMRFRLIVVIRLASGQILKFLRIQNVMFEIVVSTLAPPSPIGINCNGMIWKANLN